MVVIFGIFCANSYAMLDIFDHPKEIEKTRKVSRLKDEAKLLDYPKECLLRGDYEGALTACQRLLEEPTAKKFKADVLYLMGLSTLKLGRFLEARSYFNDVILMEAKGEDLKSNAYLGIADAYFLEGRFDNALDAYNQVLSKYPDTPAAVIINYRIGEILSKTGRPQEARQYLNKVNSEFPFSFEARLSNKDSFYHSIQVGCFNEKDNADKFCEKLVKEGFEASILESGRGDKPRLFKVKVGRFNSRDEAEAFEAKLKQAGYPTKVYP